MISIQKNKSKAKRLGQYFTGLKLANILAAIADTKKCSFVIDPMCGEGDMLSAVKRISPNSRLSGIEIDRDVYDICKIRCRNEKYGQMNLILGNAFDWKVISKLPQKKYDLVITNPPYVRYQEMTSSSLSIDDLPDAESVRRGLLNIIENIRHINRKDRNIFIDLAKGYSGLSDLAIPSWILCALLTKTGGNIAMVLPESWWSRDYAYIIHYMLFKFFRIRYVIEDVGRVWFKKAQIKTILLVATRIPRNDDLIQCGRDKQYLHIGLSSNTINDTSIVGNIFEKSVNPDLAFTKLLHQIDQGNNVVMPDGMSMTYRKLEPQLKELLKNISGNEWFHRCEPDIRGRINNSKNILSNRAALPQQITNNIRLDNDTKFTTLEEIGFNVSQGLRTGANFFFYADIVKEGKKYCHVNMNGEINSRVIVPSEATKIVLRRQKEMPCGYKVNGENLPGRVLLLEGYLVTENTADESCKKITSLGYKMMPSELIKIIKAAENINLGTNDNPRYIYELSAVKVNGIKHNIPNMRKGWYMLPRLKQRHLPDLFVPRVNGFHPKVMMNDNKKVVIDANFSTIWPNSDKSTNTYAILALLNSSWAVLLMELMGTILGGGALKLEATHIRRLPIPILEHKEWQTLTELGEELVSSTDAVNVIAQIDQTVAPSLFGAKNASKSIGNIKRIMRERLKERKT